MALLPPSTNADYRGSLAAARWLTLFSLLTIGPGCIHTFAPDGGAASIAGIDLSRDGPVIVAVFAWAGPTQIALGLLALVVSLRYRPLVPLVYAVVLLERGLHALNAWVLRAPMARHHPPEHYAVLVVLPILVLCFVLSLREARPPVRSR